MRQVCYIFVDVRGAGVPPLRPQDSRGSPASVCVSEWYVLIDCLGGVVLCNVCGLRLHCV